MTVTTELLNAAKKAKRITTDAYDMEVARLLNTAILDLGVAGVEVPESSDYLVTNAIITYFLMMFGEPDNYDRLKRSYDEQKSQLASCTGYTNWLVAT